MDIGDAGSTNFKWDGSLINAYDENEGLMEDGVRTALVHSHHNMRAFFSAVDKEELEDNTPEDVDMYLSLVVNNSMGWDCKISMFGMHKVESRVKLKKLGSSIMNHEATTIKEEKVLYIIDVKVFLDNMGSMATRVAELQKQKEEARKAAYVAPTNNSYNNGQLHLGTGMDDNDYRRATNQNWNSGWKAPTALKSLATDTDLPIEMGKLLILSTLYDGDFVDALELLEARFSSVDHISRYIQHFRKQYPIVLKELKEIALDGKEDEADWEYNMTADLLDEIIQWKGSQHPLFKGLTDELENMLGLMDPTEEEEEKEEQKLLSTEDINEIIKKGHE
jgi:hypothetical protein